MAVLYVSKPSCGSVAVFSPGSEELCLLEHLPIRFGERQYAYRGIVPGRNGLGRTWMDFLVAPSALVYIVLLSLCLVYSDSLLVEVA